MEGNEIPEGAMHSEARNSLDRSIPGKKKLPPEAQGDTWIISMIHNYDLIFWFDVGIGLQNTNVQPLTCHPIEDSNWGDVAWSECTEYCLAAAAQCDGQVSWLEEMELFS